ncbi:MAG TPA: GMC family oxidoreductase [Solirubrobacterales bacterium]|nr:GMC family oxidoreductase [Solirubrobacterales bacterium]
MAERVDVCIVGSGFGGSIAAWRLAELYRAAETNASVVVLERGLRKGHTDFRQSMDVDHLSDIYALVQGQGAQIVLANLVGGGSNLYLAASLRSPSETFERTDVHPNDGPRRRLWPAAISRRTLDPYYRRAERGLRVTQGGWREVSKSGGIWAAMLRKAGYTCDRVPLAINPERCVDAKWCYTGCIFGAKNSLITNYLASAERAGVQVRPLVQVNDFSQSSATPYRWIVHGQQIDPATKQPAGAIDDIECKVLILSGGAMGTPPIMMRSRQNGALPNVSAHLGRHLGVNGDHVAAIEINPDKVRSYLRLPRYGQFYKGKPITTMTYDFWVGKRGNEHDGTRFNLQEILLSQLTNFLYDDGRGNGEEPSWWGREKKQATSTWSDRIEILAMVEDTHDGEFFLPPPEGGGHIQPNAGPVGVGLFGYELSEQSARIREVADAAIREIAGRGGLGRFMKFTESAGVYASHPLGGCRMADDIGFGVVNDACEVHSYPGLFCMDSSAIPTSLGVNPSLTISAVCERAAANLVARGPDFGLPEPPHPLIHQRPQEIVGDHVNPA